jgi:hypothetical protein
MCRLVPDSFTYDLRMLNKVLLPAHHTGYARPCSAASYSLLPSTERARDVCEDCTNDARKLTLQLQNTAYKQNPVASR